MSTVGFIPPTIGKAFGVERIPLSGTTTLTFTLSNPNAGISLSGVGFSDTLPAGLVVATPNGLTGSCGGGTITATAGSSSVSQSGATLAASAFCSFTVNVTGTSAGTKNNTTSAVTSTEGGTRTHRPRRERLCCSSPGRRRPRRRWLFPPPAGWAS